MIDKFFRRKKMANPIVAAIASFIIPGLVESMLAI